MGSISNYLITTNVCIFSQSALIAKLSKSGFDLLPHRKSDLKIKNNFVSKQKKKQTGVSPSLLFVISSTYKTVFQRPCLLQYE